MQTEDALREYGLTDKECKVYLTLLPLGSINLQEVAKRVEYPRTTVYNTLSYLIQKGLVSKIIKESVTYFQATEPKKLINDIEERKKLMLAVLPDLENLKKQLKETSNVEIYEGFKGIATILSDVFRVKQQTYYFGSYSASVEILKYLPEHVGTLRIDNKISAKIILDPYDEPRFHEKEYKKLTEIRFLDSMKDFPCMIFIYGNKVAMYTLKGDLVGIIISNKQFASAMKMIFDMYWVTAKSKITKTKDI